MLKPEQIPEAAWQAASALWFDGAKWPEIVAAAIAAWPGAVWRESGVGREIVSRRIVLPLPQEPKA